jgi:hypothetical protein
MAACAAKEEQNATNSNAKSPDKRGCLFAFILIFYQKTLFSSFPPFIPVLLNYNC